MTTTEEQRGLFHLKERRMFSSSVNQSAEESVGSLQADCLIHLTLLHNGVIDPSLLRSLSNSIYNSLEPHMITVYQVHTDIST